MRKIFFLLFTFLAFISGSLKAENYIQFTGGNYAFAENGKLTFNLEPSLFENRTWKYNETSKSIDTEFTTNKITLKTKHASKFNVQNTTYIALTEKQKNEKYLVRPIFHNNGQFNNQKTFWPVVGIFVRVAGSIAVDLIPPAVTRCLTNNICASSVATALINFCGFNYFISSAPSYFQLPFGVCSRLAEEGYERDANGNFVKQVKYVVKYPKSPGSIEFTDKGFSTFEAAAEFAYQMSKKKEEYENRNEPCVKDVLVVNENLAYSGCKFTKMMVATYRDVKPENLTMIDLENIVIEDIKENPTPYVNSKSSLGKELRNAIKATKAEAALNAVKDDSKPADITLNPNNGKGLFTAISDPYRDENGNTMQDTVTLSTPATNSSIATPSGTLGQASSGGSGVSQTKNNVSVISKPRPDKAAEAGAGENNNKDGKGSSAAGIGGNGTGSSSGEGDGDKAEAGKNVCETNPESLACMKAGDVEESAGNPFSDVLKKEQQDGTKFEFKNILPTHGTCPSPKQFNVMGRTYEVSYYWICEFALSIRGLIIALAAVAAGFIIFSARKD